MEKKKQGNNGKFEYRTSKSKVVKINLSLFIGIIAITVMVLSSFLSYKVATVGTKIMHSLVEEIEEDESETGYENEVTVSNLTTENEDTVTLSDQEEGYDFIIYFDANGGEGEMDPIYANYDEDVTITENAFTRDGYIFTGWNTEADGSGTSYEDGATVSNLTTTYYDTITLYAQWKEEFEYTITVTEYTEDTLEAECDYEENTTIVYIVDESTLEQTDCISFENVSESYITPEETGENKIGYTTTNQKIFYSYSSNCTFTLTETEAHYTGLEEDLIWDCPVSFTKLVSYSDPLYLYEVEYYQTGEYWLMYDTVETSVSNDGISEAAIVTTALAYKQVASVGSDWEDATSEYFLSDELIIPSSYSGLTGYKYCWVNVIINEYDPITYTICFDGNDADDGEMEAIEATYDEEYTLTVNAFTREGYTFTGWNTEADGSGTSYEDGATVSNLTTEDGATVTLYAQWEEIEYDYVIYFDANGGEGEMDPIYANYNEDVTLTECAFEREDYSFICWSITEDITGDLYYEAQTVNFTEEDEIEEITLYAYWSGYTTFSYYRQCKVEQEGSSYNGRTVGLTKVDTAETNSFAVVTNTLKPYTFTLSTANFTVYVVPFSSEDPFSESDTNEISLSVDGGSDRTTERKYVRSCDNR